MQVSRFAYLILPAACLVLATSAIAQPAAPAGSGAAPAASALPAASNNGAVTSVVVSGGARALFKIAIASPPGDAAETILEATEKKPNALARGRQFISEAWVELRQ